LSGKINELRTKKLPILKKQKALLIPRLTPRKQALHDILTDGVAVRT
jgi:hypothetical protein